MPADPMAIPGMAFVIGILTLLTLVIVTVIWQLGSTYRAKEAIAREESYRKLAEQTATTQAEVAQALAEMRSRLEAIEELLREVE